MISKTTKGGSNAQTTVTVTKFTYDSLSRVTKSEKKISNTLVNGGSISSWNTHSTVAYDALGQLKKKIIYPTGGAGGTPLDSIEYDYNIRGWLLGANRAFVKDTTSTANFFGYDLGYDKTAFAVNGSSKSYNTAQYNGNITGQLWRSIGDWQLRKYDYTYDAINRLTDASFTQLNNNTFNLSAGIDFSVKITGYDANGNILGMIQKGWKRGGSVTIDSLQYNYYSYSNRLQNVIDAVNDTATRLKDFRSSKAYMTALMRQKIQYGKTSCLFIRGWPGSNIRPDRTAIDPSKPLNDVTGDNFLYYNQCAIRMSIALKNLGVSIAGAKNITNPGGRAYGNGNILGATNLAHFLKDKVLGKPIVYNGTKVFVSTLISGKTGILYFQNFIEDNGRSNANTHIELWNKVVQSLIRSLSFPCNGNIFIFKIAITPCKFN